MATSKNRKAKRVASLGVNFEHGINGAVVVYDGQEEIVLAMIPENVSVSVRQATALACKYRKVGAILNVAQSKRVLKELKAQELPASRK
jgi:hypothetical protein